jgi:hypothetical protein
MVVDGHVEKVSKNSGAKSGGKRPTLTPLAPRLCPAFVRPPVMERLSDHQGLTWARV